MNQSEALALVTYLNRAGMLQALEGQAPVWADALDDVAFPDAQEAARLLAKTVARWVTPGDIRQGVAMIRRRRVQDMATPVPPEQISPDDTRTERAWTRAYVAGIGAGLEPDAADLAACHQVRVTRVEQIEAARPVAALVAQVAADGIATQHRMAREYEAARPARDAAKANAMPRIPRKDAA